MENPLRRNTGNGPPPEEEEERDRLNNYLLQTRETAAGVQEDPKEEPNDGVEIGCAPDRARRLLVEKSSEDVGSS